MRKKVKMTSRLWKKFFNSAHCSSQAKCRLLQTVTWNELNCSCFCHIINIFLTELGRSVWEKLSWSRLCVQTKCSEVYTYNTNQVGKIILQLVTLFVPCTALWIMKPLGLRGNVFVTFSIWSFVLTLSQCHLSYSLHLVFPSFFRKTPSQRS